MIYVKLLYNNENGIELNLFLMKDQMKRIQ